MTYLFVLHSHPAMRPSMYSPACLHGFFIQRNNPVRESYDIHSFKSSCVRGSRCFFNVEPLRERELGTLLVLLHSFVRLAQARHYLRDNNASPLPASRRGSRRRPCPATRRRR